VWNDRCGPPAERPVIDRRGFVRPVGTVRSPCRNHRLPSTHYPEICKLPLMDVGADGVQSTTEEAEATMLDTDWSDSWRGAFRIELRAEAIGLAWHGWPVLPGTFPAGAAKDSGEKAGPTWFSPAPVHDDWRDRLGAHPHEVASWWTGEDYSLLVATGTVLDAVEVDDDLGKRAARLLRATGHPAPIVAMPNGRWLFLTTVADDVPAEFGKQNGIELHSKDSWIPLPPTPFQHGVVHWRVKPEVWGWQLPVAGAVHDVLVRALHEQRAGAAQQLVVAGPSAA
jgi:hypothetical protein